MEKTSQHIPALDGLRAVAILIVLLAHGGLQKVVPGGFGVTLFFFISGFLITRLMFAEFEQTGRLDIKRFYIRRVIRLYPALILAVAFTYGVCAYSQGFVIWRDVAVALLYFSNYYQISVGFGADYSPAFASMMHMDVMWSLAVEEQYYLVFPIFFILFAANREQFVRTLWWLSVLCLTWRLFLALDGSNSYRIYAGTDTRIDSILYGALLTCLLSGPRRQAFKAVLEKRWLHILALGALLATFVVREDLFRDTVRYSIQGLALMPLVAAACFSERFGWVRHMLECRPMQLIGAWSYSLYLFNQLGQTLGEMVTHESPLDGYQGLSFTWYAVAISSTLVMSLFSYYGVERPFISLRHRFGSHAR